MFAGIAIAEAPALAAFIVAFVRGSAGDFVVALPLTLLGLWRVAPSRRNLERERLRLLRDGSTLEPTLALIAATPIVPPTAEPPARPDAA